MASNNLGCFERLQGDSTWNKVVPQSGFARTNLVYRDDAGDIFAEGQNLTGSIYTGPWLVEKSTDNGNTWNPDTAGISAISMYCWWVDESGNQYAGGIGGHCSNYVKSPSGSWQLDNNGVLIDTSYDVGTAFGSDHNGTVYYALYSGNVFSRAQSGGAWTENSGIGGDQIYSFAHTSNHTMIAGGNSNVHYKTGSGWQTMSISAPAPQGTTPFEVAVDGSDNVWVAFSHQGGTGNYIGDGVFYTHDLGNTWTAAAGQVTTVTFRSLVPSGDSVFGVSYFNGVYVFKTGSGLAVQKISDGPQYLAAFPNPANKEVNIRYFIGEGAQVSLQIYDVAGNLVQELKNETQAAGMFQTPWNVASVARGTYICKLTGTGQSGTLYRQDIKILVE